MGWWPVIGGVCAGILLAEVIATLCGYVKARTRLIDEQVARSRARRGL